MKNLSLILNFILLVAVGILYYLHFNTEKPEAEATTTEAPVLLTEPATSAIVFVNSDSLLTKYDYLKSKKTELEARQKKMEAEMEAESSKLRKDYENYQQRGALMTDAQRQQTEEQLMMRQQQLMQKEKTLLSKLDDEQEKINETLHNNLTTFLKDYNKGKNYQFILGYQKGGGILLANDSLDITQWVLEGLNKKYSEAAKTAN
jgi:outer membrane protein